MSSLKLIPFVISILATSGLFVLVGSFQNTFSDVVGVLLLFIFNTIIYYRVVAYENKTNHTGHTDLSTSPRVETTKNKTQKFVNKASPK